jgi:arylsulfatase
MYEGNSPVAVTEDFYATDTLTDVACRYIDELESDDDSPFFLYLAYNAPHWPLNSKWEEFQKYRGQYRGGWDALIQSRLKRQEELGLFTGVSPATHEGPAWDSLNDKQRDDLDAIMAAYAGCIDSIDQNVGKLTRKLEATGELENTLICFLSDNGSCQEGGTLGKGDEAMVKNPPGGVGGVRLGRAWAGASNTPFRLYKHFVHEGGASTPMIAHWPAGIPDGKDGGFVRQFAYLPDFMATFVELSGAKYPSDKPQMVGSSFANTLRGSDAPIHEEAIFWEHEGNAAMRDGDWKLVREYKKPWELFNIGQDRTEMVNLATAMPQRRDSMIARWEAWASKHDVAFPRRFNMYEYLNQQKKQAKQEEAKAAKRK